MPADPPAAAAPAATTAAPPPAPAAAAAPPAASPAAAAPAPAPAAAAPAAAAPGNVIAEAKPAPPTLDAVKAFLTEKGAKAEDLAALDEAGLRAKYEGEQKAAEEAAKKAGQPKAEDFEVKAPEGVELDAEQVKALQETLADANLSPKDRAQKLFDQHQQALTKAIEAPVQLWNETQTKWQAEWKADAEIGGANYDQTVANIAKMIDEYGGKDSKAIREAFVFTGAGNNPAIGRFVARMAKALVESGPFNGDSPAKLGKNDSVAGALYPTMPNVREGVPNPHAQP